MPRMADGRHNYGALANVDMGAILDRIADGEYVPALASELGVSKQALAKALAKRDRDAYLAAREIAAEVRLEEVTMAIEQARDQVDLARARELFRAVAWRAEREHPHRWGAKPSTAIQVNASDGAGVQIVSYASQDAAQTTVSLPQQPPLCDAIDDENGPELG
jgi:hypothetical protein